MDTDDDYLSSVYDPNDDTVSTDDDDDEAHENVSFVILNKKRKREQPFVLLLNIVCSKLYVYFYKSFMVFWQIKYGMEWNNGVATRCQLAMVIICQR